MRGNATLAVTLALVMAGCGSGQLAPPETEPAPQTGAVTTVSATEARNAKSVRLDDLLRGRAPGLDIIVGPDGKYQLRIRGLSSINESPPPLILVDGIEVALNALEVSLAGLTRDDIKQVTVLRDVASTSVYGTRGAGGVVLITTARR